MSMLVEITVLIATLVGSLLGGCCIYWVKACPCARRARWGRRLFIVTQIVLGGMAADCRCGMAVDGLAPLGLLSGLLIVGMLWEGSASAIRDDSAPTS